MNMLIAALSQAINDKIPADSYAAVKNIAE